jgi:hypothetical protein
MNIKDLVDKYHINNLVFSSIYKEEEIKKISEQIKLHENNKPKKTLFIGCNSQIERIKIERTSGEKYVLWEKEQIKSNKNKAIKNRVFIEKNKKEKKVKNFLITQKKKNDNIIIEYMDSLMDPVRENSEEYKFDFSIVMAYYNRKEQTLETLKGFEKLYAGKYNFEVIIVDDNSNQENKLNNVINDFTYTINLIEISEEEKGSRINPGMAYNIGFKKTMGKIIIIQNPECYHVGNILEYTKENLNEQDYFSYSCFSVNTKELTKKLLSHNNIHQLINDPSFLNENKLFGINWYNHPTEPGRNVAYHFCSAIYKDKLDLIGGFDKRFIDGYCFDDDAFVLSIKFNLKLNIKIIEPNNVFVIHQHHEANPSLNCEDKDDSHPIKKKWLKNKKLFEEIKKIHERNNFIYPKLMFLYWDNSPLSYLNYLTIESFNNFNPEWKIIIFRPIKNSNIITWNTGEQKTKYDGKDYFYKLENINNVEIKYICLNSIGFNNNASEVIKSDYFRYYILEKHGGLWSDFDILYTASIEEKMNFEENNVIFRCSPYTWTGEKRIKINREIEQYFPIGLFLSKPLSIFFRYIKNKCLENYNPKNYQTFGASLFLNLFPNIEKIHEIDNIKICNEDYYLPWSWNESSEFYGKLDNILPDNNIGIHWFNGLEESKKFAYRLNSRFSNFNVTCYLDKFISKYINKCSHNINFLMYFNDEFEKLKIFIKNIKNIYAHSNIFINLITNKENEHFNELNLENIITYKSFKNAIENINADYIFYQNIIVSHDENLNNLLETYNLTKYDYIGLNKEIQNNKLTDKFKELIYDKKLPDIVYFNKKTFLDKNIVINSDFLLLEDLKNIKLKTNKISYLFPEKIPRIIHFYWDGSKFDYLSLLTLKTFVFNNPDWVVNLWMPKIVDKKKIVWESQEFIPPHAFQYNDKDYLNLEELEKLLGINIKNIDYFDLKLHKNYTEVLKSDIFRWKILNEYGGVWSDMDILFIDKIEKTNFDFIKKDKFNDIDLVISQYQRYIQGIDHPIDFYYIGFLMCAPNSEFFKIMYNKSLVNINKKSYQGVGGDLMKSYFGLFDNVKTKINSDNYVNLQSDSIYYYWWADLLNLYINKCEDDKFFTLQSKNIIGFHWFRGVHMSKVYNNFLNYSKKIHNFENFRGPLIEWVEYYKNIFNDFKENNFEKKISIVMGYINRLPQLEITLQTINKTKHVNYEIIIINDGNEDLDYLIKKYPNSNIKIVYNSDKTYVNPAISYNKGIDLANGEIILLQNPECCHVGDILTIINCILKQNDYLAFSCYYLDNYEKNTLLNNILFKNNNDDEINFWNKDKFFKIYNFTTDYANKSILPKENRGWSSHHKYKPNYLHFCTAIYKNDLIKIGKFSDEYKDGICFDDDDLVRKVILNKLNNEYYLIPQEASSYPQLSQHAAFVFHQHHDRFEYSDNGIMEKWENNKNIFINSNSKYINIYIKEIIKNLSYEIKIKNGNILNFDTNNNKYLMEFNTNDSNTIMIKLNIPKNFEYIFNGGNLKLSNNIIEILDQINFNVIITSEDLEEININDEIINKENEKFNYFGKIKKGKLIIKNIQKKKINIEVKIINKEIDYKDNTLFEEI